MSTTTRKPSKFRLAFLAAREEGYTPCKCVHRDWVIMGRDYTDGQPATVIAIRQRDGARREVKDNVIQ